MTLHERWERDHGIRALAALLLNLLFLLALLLLFAPGYDTNDDRMMSGFVDGQIFRKTAYIPFINILLGLLLKGLYTLGSDAVNWYTGLQYLVMLGGFTALTWCLFERLPFLRALAVSGILLLCFGTDGYLTLNFTKVAAIGTVGGLGLMLHAQTQRQPGRLGLPLVLGALLAIAGFMWRAEEFFCCAALLAALGLCRLIAICRGQDGKGKQMLHFVLPFALLLAVVLGLYGADALAWSKGEWGEYKAYNQVRHLMMDYGVPAYDTMQETYDELGLDENAVSLLRSWSFHDPDTFSAENLSRIIAQRDARIKNIGAGDCLRKLFQECLPCFFETQAFLGLLLLAVLWLACGRHGLAECLSLGYMLAAFTGMYCYLIYDGRCLLNRVDMGMFFAMAAVLACWLRPEKGRGKTGLCVLLLAFSLAIGYRANRAAGRFDPNSQLIDRSAEKAAVERILQDDEHLYLYKILSLRDPLYGPLETYPAGYNEKFVALGGWGTNYPYFTALLDSYGIQNCFRDVVGNERVYLIDSRIELTMAYINKYYDPAARAEEVEALSEETGLEIYRILAGA